MGAALDDKEMDGKIEPTGATPDATIDDQSARKDQIPRDPPASPTPKNDEGLLTKVFQFLATATPGTLGGIALGLGAITYLVLGRIGLLLIGAFGGVALFIQWEARNAEVARVVRGERGVDLMARLLDGREAAKHTIPKDEIDPDEEEQILARGFDDFRPETQDALNGLVDAIIRDYVKWWYSPIVPSDKFFPLSCRKILTSFLLSISNHLSRKRPADAFLDFLTNSSSIIIVFFSELSAAFADLPSDSTMTAADAVYQYLASNPESSLANLLSQRQQAGKFRMVAEDLLGFLDRPTYECDPARVFLREILAGVILEMTLQTCSKPEWINSWIVYLLEAGEPDISQAIDVGMQTRPGVDNAFVDIDGNVGSIPLSKGNRNSFEIEKARRKEGMSHKKKLSKADEEMEVAMEEMKRLNQMIAEEDARRAGKSMSAAEASERLADAMKRNADELDIQPELHEKDVQSESEPRESTNSDNIAPRAVSSDGISSKGETVHTPITPHSVIDTASQNSSPKRDTESPFTSFDQIVPPAQEEAELGEDEMRKPQRFTLHNAVITIHDEPVNDKGRLRSKPSWDYLIQIEPATSQSPGWMIVRKYSDFERLHEILRRIATISGATAFSEQHSSLPNWKVHTRGSLRGELERYVRDACWYQPLAESEGMRRFLEKDNQGHGQTASKSGFQAFENMGKNVLDVLAVAPKGALEGSKAVVGGVSGVLGSIPGLGPRKSTSSSLQDVTAASRASISTPPRMDSSLSTSGILNRRDSIDSQRSSVVSTQPTKMPPMERRPSYNSQGEADAESPHPVRPDRWDRPSASVSARNSREHSRASSLAPLRSPSVASLDALKLPPRPDEIPDDYGANIGPTLGLKPSNGIQDTGFESPTRSPPKLQAKKPNGIAPKPAHQYAQLSEPETRVAVELLFAVINELYTLSSAWNIRRTLLAAAKSFLLRPGNPSLVSIQSLIQASVLDANTSDGGIAIHLRKLRENTLPTDEERAAWPPEDTPEQKERLRVRARALLIRSGVPAALMGVMGQTATSEALGRVFDALQVEEVARGLMFGVMLQAVRTVTH